MQFITYTRVSTQEQGQSRNGIEGQERAIQAFILSGGHEVLEAFSEVASGKHDEDRRPILKQALAQVKATGATLLVSKLDRLSRNVQFISTLMQEKIRFATVEDGLEVEPFMLHLKAMFAEQELRRISERTKAGLASAKARGVKMGFAAHKDPASAVVARTNAGKTNLANAVRFAQSIAPSIQPLLATMTYAQIADHLNGLGVRTERNGTWHPSSVHTVLKHAGIVKKA